MADIKLKHFFWIPNLFSLIRFVLVVPIWILLQKSDQTSNILLLAIVGFAILSDWLDGFFARVLDQKSDLGRLLDPLADKFLMVAGLVGFVIYREFPLALLLLLAYRDFLIAIGGILIARKSGEITESNFWGKANTTVVSVAGFFFLLIPDWIGTQVLLVLSYISILISGTSYLLAGTRKLAVRKSILPPLMIACGIPVVLILYFFRYSLI
jgi:CDP-diacylglycerol--glycerol-3-phosphate 3-phosphatidyltransferase